MFPMGGIDPKQMNNMLRQMGVKTEDLDAQKVSISLNDGSTIEITSPSITKIDFKGQVSFQISGNVAKSQAQIQNDDSEDVKLIMMQTNSTEKVARQALEESNGDLAAAILKLKKE